MNRPRLLLAYSAVAAAIAGVPEPEVVFYGHVTRSPLHTAYVPTGVEWSLSGNGETVAVSQTALVSVNGDIFYVTRIPFETRKLADNTPLSATPNTLSLQQVATTYTRRATVDGRLAIMPDGAGIFRYGAAFQGLVERLDLVVAETYDEWSQRLFGSIVSETSDPDGDGQSNYSEYFAGTEPQDSTSVFKASTDITPIAGGGLIIRWSSVGGRRYSIQRASDLSQPFQTLEAAVAAEPPVNQYTDGSATGAGPFFYRVRIDP